MRTTLDLPDELVHHAMKASHQKTKTAAIIAALQDLVRKSRHLMLFVVAVLEVEPDLADRRDLLRVLLDEGERLLDAHRGGAVEVVVVLVVDLDVLRKRA